MQVGGLEGPSLHVTSAHRGSLIVVADTVTNHDTMTPARKSSTTIPPLFHVEVPIPHLSDAVHGMACDVCGVTEGYVSGVGWVHLQAWPEHTQHTTPLTCVP